MKPPASSGARRGKVARLPNEIRNLVNIMLNDGAPYSAIVRRLSELGYPGFATFNICRWRKGGYEDWLAAQEKFDLEKLRAEITDQAIKDLKGPSALHDASEIQAALITFRALRAADSIPEEELLKDPSFFRLAAISNRQLAERTRRERLEARKKLTEAEFIDQLIANPEKLNRVLTLIRTRCAPAVSPGNPAPPCATQNTIPDPTLKPLSPDGATSSPSPLNGERAGVRGETAPDASDQQSSPSPSASHAHSET